MENRRTFLGKAVITGIAGILATKTAPVFAQNLGMVKVSQLGLGSHGFLGSFSNPPADMKAKVKCYPYGVWDNAPGVAEKMKTTM